MALPAMKLEPEDFVEERVARLEVNVAHLQADVSELKQDVRAFRQEVKQDMHAFRQEVKQEMQAFRQEVKQDVQRLDNKIDAIKDMLANMEKRFSKLDVARMLDRVWYLMTSAALLGVMARGFRWI